MPDRITQLERLNRLRAEGGLSDQEFEREKQMLLEAAPRRFRVFAIPALAIAIVAAVLLVLFLRREPEVGATGAAQQKGVAPVTTPASAPPRPATPPPLDISSRIGIADGDCHFAPDLQRAFTDMLVQDDRGRTVGPEVVRIGALRLMPVVTSARDEGVDLPNYRRYVSSVSFPSPALWNGLRLRGLRVENGWEFSSRAIEFEETPGAVRSTMRRIGIAVPPPPAYRELPTEGCSSSIGVETRANGAALVCTSWC